MNESIIIIDFGSQVTKLIARRIREFGVFSQIVPFNKVTKKLLGIKEVVIHLNILVTLNFSCLME